MKKQKQYKAIIKNISQNQYITHEVQGEVTLSKFKKDALLFVEEADAETTLELLNDTQPDCFTLIQL